MGEGTGFQSSSRLAFGKLLPPSVPPSAGCLVECHDLNQLLFLIPFISLNVHIGKTLFVVWFERLNFVNKAGELLKLCFQVDSFENILLLVMSIIKFSLSCYGIKYNK